MSHVLLIHKCRWLLIVGCKKLHSAYFCGALITYLFMRLRSRAVQIIILTVIWTEKKNKLYVLVSSVKLPKFFGKKGLCLIIGVVARAIAGWAAAMTDVVDGRSLPPAPPPSLPTCPTWRTASLHYYIKHTPLPEDHNINTACPN